MKKEQIEQKRQEQIGSLTQLRDSAKETGSKEAERAYQKGIDEIKAMSLDEYRALLEKSGQFKAKQTT